MFLAHIQQNCCAKIIAIFFSIMTTHLFQLLFLTFFITIVSCNEVAQLKNEVIEYNEDSKERNVQSETKVTHLKAGNFLKPFLSFARNTLILFRLTWPFGSKGAFTNYVDKLCPFLIMYLCLVDIP